MYPKPSPIRSSMALFAMLLVFCIGVYLLNQTHGLEELNKHLQANDLTHPYLENFGYSKEDIDSYLKNLDAFGSPAITESGASIVRSLLLRDYFFIVAYVVLGYFSVYLIKLGNLRVTHSYRKSARLFLAFVALADCVENGLLLSFLNQAGASTLELAAPMVLIASAATSVKWVSLLVLGCVFLFAAVSAFRRWEPPVPGLSSDGEDGRESGAGSPEAAIETDDQRAGKKPVKNIVLFSDGTGNSSASERGTNVFKLYEALVMDDPDQSQRRQLAFYDEGVGTEQNKLLNTLGGAFGVGLATNVKELYKELCRNYEPGDQIYLFGFSRGAFTVRTLAGMIANCGILKPCDDLDELVEDMYYFYRTRYPTDLQKWLPVLSNRSSTELDNLAAWCRKWTYPIPEGSGDDRLIAFLGVWDTVDAYGFPWDPLARIVDKTLYKFTFPDNELNNQVARARHALAIDDERKTFHPVLWDESGESDSDRIQQVWFAGVHSNVGGGYQRQGLSLVSLRWIMLEAEKAGLRLIASKRDEYTAMANPFAHLYDSRAGFGLYYAYKPRAIDTAYCKADSPPKVHISTVARIAYAGEGYSPGNFPVKFQIVDDTGNSGFTELQRVVEAYLGDRPLVSQKGRYVRGRQWSQTLLVVASFGLLSYTVFFSDNGIKGALESFGIYAFLVVAFLGLTQAFGVLPFVGKALTYFRRKQSAHFVSHWNKIRPKLRQLVCR